MRQVGLAALAAIFVVAGGCGDGNGTVPQGKKPFGTIGAMAQEKGMYGMYAIAEGADKPEFGVAGYLLLPAGKVSLALDDITEKGYRLHSVVGNGQGEFIVIAEK